MAMTTALRLATGFVGFVLIARHLGAVQFGTLTYWMTISFLAALVVGFGSGPYMLKEIGANPQMRQSVVGGVGASKVLLTLAVGLVSLLATPFLGDHAVIYWCLLISAVADVVAEYVFCAFRGMNDYLTEVWFSTATSCIHLGLVVLTIWLGGNLEQVAATFMLSRVLAAVGAGVSYKKRFGIFGIRENWRDWKHALLGTKAYAADAFLTNVYSQMDSLLLNHLSGPGALGIYQAGLRVMQGLNSLAPILSNVYLPKLANELKNNHDHSHTARVLYAQLVGFGLTVALLFGLFSTPLIDALYGQSFSSLKPLLPWFGALLLLRLFASYYGILLTASGQQATRAWSIGICLVIVVICGFYLIPAHGALGMVWSSLIATLALATIYLMKTQKSHANPRWSPPQFIFSAAGFVVVLALLACTYLSAQFV